MNDETSNLPEPKKHRLPTWMEDARGRKRLNGQWSVVGVAEYITNNPRWHSVDELARLVYGSTSENRRKNVRQHIAKQRRHMLDILHTPIVTRFGHNGIILAVKLFILTNDDDRILLKAELERARDRCEITAARYKELHNIFLITDQRSDKEAD